MTVNLSEVNFEGQVVNRVPFYKYIEMYLDQSLFFKEHVTRLNSKIPSHLGLLRGARNNLPVYTAERVFATMILPKLGYCHFVLNNLAPSSY